MNAAKFQVLHATFAIHRNYTYQHALLFDFFGFVDGLHVDVLTFFLDL